MRERKREREREREKRERKTERERPEIGAGVDIVATNFTATTTPRPGVTSSRPAFEEKRGKEREKDR